MGWKRADLGPLRADLRSERGRSSLGKAGRDGQTDGQMYGRADIWKFTPVSYRTSALWGCCPKRIELNELNKPNELKC